MKYCPLCERSYPDTTDVCEIDGAALKESRPRQDTLTGKIIKGRYQIIKKLGDGGMGTVYLAEQVAISRQVALKILHADYARDIEFVRRFRQEARLAASLNHRNVITVYDFDQADDGSLFIVMEYVDGISLSQLIQNGPMDVPRAVNLAGQIAEGLSAAHRAGVIHRDVKPENIMVAAGDDIKLMDFGIARLRDTGAASRLTRLGTIMGTPAYMAPEQIEGGDVSEKTDIYAFGIVLYEMLSGVAPFRAPTPAAVLMKHLHEVPTPLRKIRRELPPALERIVSQALEKSPEKRQQDFAGVIDGLGRLRYSKHLSETSTASAVGRPFAKIFQSLIAMPARLWGRGRAVRGFAQTLVAGFIRTPKGTQQEVDPNSEEGHTLASADDQQLPLPEKVAPSGPQILEVERVDPSRATSAAESIESTPPSPLEQPSAVVPAEQSEAEPLSSQSGAITGVSQLTLATEVFTDTISPPPLEDRASEKNFIKASEEVLAQEPLESGKTEVISGAADELHLTTNLSPHPPPASELPEATQSIPQESEVQAGDRIAETAILPTPGVRAETTPSAQIKESTEEPAADQITHRTEALAEVVTSAPHAQASSIDTTLTSGSTIEIERSAGSHRPWLVGIGSAAALVAIGFLASLMYNQVRQETSTVNVAQKPPSDLSSVAEVAPTPVEESVPTNSPRETTLASESKSTLSGENNAFTPPERLQVPDRSPREEKQTRMSRATQKVEPIETTKAQAPDSKQPPTPIRAPATVVPLKKAETKPTTEKPAPELAPSRQTRITEKATPIDTKKTEAPEFKQPPTPQVPQTVVSMQKAETKPTTEKRAPELAPSRQAETAETAKPVVKDTPMEITSLGKSTAKLPEKAVLPPEAPRAAPAVKSELLSLLIVAAKREFDVNERLMLSVKGRYTGGKEQEVLGGGVRWDTSDSNVAIVNSRGELEARGEGKAQVTAKYLGVTSSAIIVSVRDRQKVIKTEKEDQGIKDVRRRLLR